MNKKRKNGWREKNQEKHNVEKHSTAQQMRWRLNKKINNQNIVCLCVCGNNIIKHTHTNRVQNEQEKKIENFFFTLLFFITMESTNKHTNKLSTHSFIHSLMMSNREKYIKKKKKVFWCLVSLSPDIIIQLYFFFARITPKHTHTRWLFRLIQLENATHTHKYQINFFFLLLVHDDDKDKTRQDKTKTMARQIIWWWNDKKKTFEWQKIK